MFLASILSFVMFHCQLCLNMKVLQRTIFDWPIMGKVGLFRVVLRLRGIKNCFQPRPKKFSLKSYMTPLYFLKLVFPKFDPLTVTGMVLSVNLGPKYQQFCLNIKIQQKKNFDWAMNGGDTIISLSLRLRGIEFSLVCV